MSQQSPPVPNASDSKWGIPPSGRYVQGRDSNYYSTAPMRHTDGGGPLQQGREQYTHQQMDTRRQTSEGVAVSYPENNYGRPLHQHQDRPSPYDIQEGQRQTQSPDSARSVRRKPVRSSITPPPSAYQPQQRSPERLGTKQNWTISENRPSPAVELPTNEPATSTATVAFSNSDSNSNSDPEKNDGASNRRRWPWAHSFLRRVPGCFRILFYNILQLCGWKPREERKYIISKNRWRAIFRTLVHLIPMSGCAVIIYFNLSNFYIGGELAGESGQDVQKLAALNFAAKLHELFMLSSMAAIIIMFLRKELAVGAGVPFGALLSSQDFKSISYLWSQGFWGSISQKWERRRVKWMLLSLIVLCTFLGIAVGPATSILMKPMEDFWLGGGTTFWIDVAKGANELFPDKVEDEPKWSHCATLNADRSCPSGDWDLISRQLLIEFPRLRQVSFLPFDIIMPGRDTTREFNIFSRNALNDGTGYRMMYANAFAMASIQPSVLGDALVDLGRHWVSSVANHHYKWTRLKYRNTALFKVPALAPITMTRCRLIDGDYESLPFSDLGSIKIQKGPETADASDADFNRFEELSEGHIFDSAQEMRETNVPQLVFFDDSDLLEKTNSLLSAVATIPPWNGRPSRTFSCSIDTKLGMSDIQIDWANRKRVFGNPFNRGYARTGIHDRTDTRDIRLSAKWAQYVNPTDNNRFSNASVFSHMTRSVGLWETDLEIAPSFIEQSVEVIIVSLIANALGRLHYNHSIVFGENYDWDDPADLWRSKMLPKNKKMGKRGDIPAFNVSPEDKERYQQFEFLPFAKGYAYTRKGKTQLAAMFVLLAYCLLALIHSVYSLFSGWSTEEWGTGIHVTALAMNSESTEKLTNTGAGIEATATYSSIVKIQVKDEKAQLVFEDTETGVKVVPNKTYG